MDLYFDNPRYEHTTFGEERVSTLVGVPLITTQDVEAMTQIKDALADKFVGRVEFISRLTDIVNPGTQGAVIYDGCDMHRGRPLLHVLHAHLGHNGHSSGFAHNLMVEFGMSHELFMEMNSHALSSPGTKAPYTIIAEKIGGEWIYEVQ